MNGKIKTLLLIIAGLSSSCRGFLDIEPQDEISREEALSSITGVETALIGAYNGLTQEGYYKQLMTTYPEVAGNIEPSPNGVSDGDIAGSENATIVTFRDAYTFSNTAIYADSRLSDLYGDIYTFLDRVNNVIQAIPKLDEGTESRRNSLLGEAYMLRAMGHFDLLRLYSQPYPFTAGATHPGAVLADRPISVFAFPRRGTVREGFDLVIADLQQAAQLIGPNARRTQSPIWLSGLAARGLLARVYAYTGNWEGVIAEASAVINSGVYALTPASEYLNGWTSGQLNEMIFSIDLQRFVNPEEGGIITGVSQIIGADNQEPICRMSSDLIGLFAPADLRRQLFAVNNGGDTLSRKYPFKLNTVQNIPYLRLSELFLLRAEAYAEIGQESLARADYDRIHRRAVANAAPTDLSGEALKEEIFNERRRELALEGHLLFDLARKGIDIRRADCLPFNPNCNLIYPDYRYILPLPLEAIEANPNLVQNEGY